MVLTESKVIRTHKQQRNVISIFPQRHLDKLNRRVVASFEIMRRWSFLETPSKWGPCRPGAEARAEARGRGVGHCRPFSSHAPRDRRSFSSYSAKQSPSLALNAVRVSTSSLNFFVSFQFRFILLNLCCCFFSKYGQRFCQCSATHSSFY